MDNFEQGVVLFCKQAGMPDTVQKEFVKIVKQVKKAEAPGIPTNLPPPTTDMLDAFASRGQEKPPVMPPTTGMLDAFADKDKEDEGLPPELLGALLGGGAGGLGQAGLYALMGKKQSPLATLLAALGGGGVGAGVGYLGKDKPYSLNSAKALREAQFLQDFIAGK